MWIFQAQNSEGSRFLVASLEKPKNKRIRGLGKTFWFLDYKKVPDEFYSPKPRWVRWIPTEWWG